MRSKDFDINKLISELKGFSASINEVTVIFWPGMTKADLTMREISDIKKKIKKCDNCGCWIELDELSINDDGDEVCEECL